MTAPLRFRPVRLAVLLFALVPSGCGPIEYVNQATRRAAAEVEAAKAVDAEKHSPYYFTLAVEYLHKARDEAAHADFQAAGRFGRKAEKAAQIAQKEASDRAKEPGASDEAPIDPSGVAPIDDVDDETPGELPDGDDELPPGMEGSR